MADKPRSQPTWPATAAEIIHLAKNQRWASLMYEQMATEQVRKAGEMASDDGTITVKTTGQALADAIIAYSYRLAELNSWAHLLYLELTRGRRRRRRDTDED